VCRAAFQAHASMKVKVSFDPKTTVMGRMVQSHPDLSSAATEASSWYVRLTAHGRATESRAEPCPIGRREQIKRKLRGTGVIRLTPVSFDCAGSCGNWRERQGNCILFAGKAGEDLRQEVVIPARLESFAAEAAV